MSAITDSERVQGPIMFHLKGVTALLENDFGHVVLLNLNIHHGIGARTL